MSDDTGYPETSIIVTQVVTSGTDTDFKEVVLSGALIPVTPTATMSGVGLTSPNIQGALEQAASAIDALPTTTEAVMVSGSQTISGQKTFTQDIVASGLDNLPNTDLNITVSGTQDFNVFVNGKRLQQLSDTGEMLFKSHSAYSGSDLQTVTTATQTTDNTVTRFFTLPLEDNSLYWFEALVAGRKASGGTFRSRMEINRGAVYREAGGSATLIGTVDNTLTRSLVAGAYDIVVTVSGNDLVINVDGDTGETVNWTGTIFYQRISGNT